MGTRRRLRLGFTLGLGVTLIGSLMTGTPAQAGPATPLAVPGAPEWHEGASTSAAARSGRPADVRVRGGRRLLLDVDAMVRTLARTPRSHGNRNRASVIGLPTPEGRVARFAVTESPVVEPALGARRPETRSYAGTGLDDPTASVRLDRGPSGFRAQVRSARGGWLIDPEARGDTRRHVAYRRADLVNNHGPRRELGPRPARRSQATDRAGSTIGPEARTAAARSIGSQLRTYRLALATTGEYSQYHGGTVPLVHNALVSAVNRLNGIFETELGVRLVLVANNDSLINLNPATDPYSNADAGALLTQNQNRIDTVIGNANYDVGHVFSTGGGGLAGLGVIGISGEKAQGETGSNAPTGDAFWVDYVAHEVGHQFGGDHTFSGTGGNCGGNGNPTTAVEPGSGSTIMGYAGICASDDIQVRDAPAGSSDPYFHTRSFDEIQTVMARAGQGGTTSATGNTAPAVTQVGGATWTVPIRTPFTLTATATDPDVGATLSTQWEQNDGGSLRPLASAPKSGGALFRSFAPIAGASGARTFPKLASIFANTTNANTGSCPALPGGLACWSEFLPTSARTLRFRATARDNRAGGGGVTNAGATVTVAGSSPFRVTSQNTATSATGGSALTVTWNVAGTNVSPFNVANVDIRITTNGGTSYTMLAASTPNDGTQTVTVPTLNTTTARIQVRAVGSIFFDLNDANLSISSTRRLLENPGFENGATTAPWTASPGTVTNTGANVPRSGTWKAELGGDGTTKTETLTQDVTIPSGVQSATLAYWLRTVSADTGTVVNDTLTLRLRNPSTNAVITTLASFSNRDAGSSYVARFANLTPYAGQSVRIALTSQENGSLATAFVLDDFALSVQMLANGGFESGGGSPAPWTASAGVITDSGAFPARTGAWKARFGGTGGAGAWTLTQTLALPANAAQITLACWLRISTEETGSTAYDTLAVQLRNPSTNAVITSLASYSNVNAGTGYGQRSFNLSAFRGQSLRLSFTGQEDDSLATAFLVDDCTLVRT